MKIATTILLFAVLVRADTITLVNSEILTGEIIAETGTEFRLRTANADYTITSVRIIPKSEVKTVVRDSPEQKTQRAACENLCRYRLNPDQEYTAEYYRQVIALIEQYLATWTDDAIRAKHADWTFEMAQVSKGLVKYNNRWMSVADKTTALTLAAQEARAAVARKNLETRQRRLADLQARQEALNRDIAATSAKLEVAEAALASLRDFAEPIYEFRPAGGYPYAVSSRYGPVVWSSPFWERCLVGERVTRHPLRTYYEQQTVAERLHLDRLQESLSQTERDIRAATADLEKEEAANR